jgi:hypothetical protein
MGEALLGRLFKVAMPLALLVIILDFIFFNGIHFLK